MKPIIYPNKKQIITRQETFSTSLNLLSFYGEIHGELSESQTTQINAKALISKQIAQYNMKR